MTKPLQSATRNSNVCDVRLRGSFSRTGTLMIFSTTCGRLPRAPATLAATPRVSFLAVDSGWPTLQLSR